MKFINKNLIIAFLCFALAPLAFASDFRDVNITTFDEDYPAEEIQAEEQIEPIENAQNFQRFEEAKPQSQNFANEKIPIETANADEHAKNVYSNSSYETINISKDNNEKLYGVVGKSQVLSFDRSISRVSITDNAIADLVVLSSRQILINGKKAGATSVIFWGANDKPMFYNLIIQQNADNFLEAVEHIAPNENVSIIFNDDGAVLTGYLSSSLIKDKIAQVAKAYGVKLTDVTESPTKQVLLEVKITEVSKNLARELGLKAIMAKRTSFVGESLGKVGDTDWKITKDGNDTVRIIETGAGFIFGTMVKGKYLFSLEASEGKGDIKVLAEPKLLAINNEEGSFSVGNQVPIPSGMGQYGNISYDYKDTGVILKFKPQIMEETQRVRLELSPEVSEVDDSVSVASTAGTKVYGFKTRKVKTTVELNSGETLVIAGLLQNSSSRSRTQVPILGNIPIIGNLFSYTKDDKRDTDLIIFITPRIIDNSKPVHL